MLLLFGFLSFVIAVIDLTVWLFGGSLTGSHWSPAVFVLLGVLFFMLEAPTRSPRQDIGPLG